MEYLLTYVFTETKIFFLHYCSESKTLNFPEKNHISIFSNVTTTFNFGVKFVPFCIKKFHDFFWSKFLCDLFVIVLPQDVGND